MLHNWLKTPKYILTSQEKKSFCSKELCFWHRIRLSPWDTRDFELLWLVVRVFEWSHFGRLIWKDSRNRIDSSHWIIWVWVHPEQIPQTFAVNHKSVHSELKTEFLRAFLLPPFFLRLVEIHSESPVTRLWSSLYLLIAIISFRPTWPIQYIIYWWATEERMNCIYKWTMHIRSFVSQPLIFNSYNSWLNHSYPKIHHPNAWIVQSSI